MDHKSATSYQEGLDECLTVGPDCDANCFAQCLEEVTPSDQAVKPLLSIRDSYNQVKKVIEVTDNCLYPNNPESKV